MLKLNYIYCYLIALAFTLYGCSSDDSVDPQLPITTDNLEGDWQLTSLEGTPIDPEVAYFYISLKDSTSFEIYETMNSGAYHHRTGEYKLSEQGQINGYYHHTDSTLWKQAYQIHKLTMSSMTWIGKKTNEQQVFTRVTSNK